MKKIFLIVLLFSSISSKLLAQDEKNSVKINPLSALFRTGSVFYERKISPTASLQLGAAYVGLKLDETKFRGLSITPEYHYYVKKNALNGLYIGPYARYQNYSVKDEEFEGTYSSFGGGVVFGRQWVYKSGFVLDMFLGPSFNSGNFKLRSGTGEPDFNGGIDGLGLRTGILIGLGF